MYQMFTAAAMPSLPHLSRLHRPSAVLFTLANVFWQNWAGKTGDDDWSSEPDFVKAELGVEDEF
jgi:hypothetical protein